MAFKSVIEPSLERLPLLEVLHVERYEGRDFVVSHIIRRNIFTEFDAKLSRHLGALRGAGFPSISVSVRLRERNEAEGWRQARALSFPSVPHALASIGRRALGKGKAATMRLHYQGFHDTAERGQGLRRIIRPEDLEVLEAALSATRHLGESAFLDITGDFDLVMVKPANEDLAPVMFDLYNRRVTIPGTETGSRDSIDTALFDFDRFVAENPAARSYLANARHGLVAAKELSVHQFRAAAEDRIIAVDKTLSGRALEFHRLDAVVGLVARLKAGLGDDLRGLSEDARITAFDWAMAIERESDAPARRPATPVRPVLTARGSGRSAAYSTV